MPSVPVAACLKSRWGINLIPQPAGFSDVVNATLTEVWGSGRPACILPPSILTYDLLKAVVDMAALVFDLERRAWRNGALPCVPHQRAD
jgi:hypothetical protein